ncbi:MAG: YHYH protein [Phycisphaerales bacterium]|nr:YHYH protein [Phycisphaerales bacterium]
MKVSIERENGDVVVFPLAELTAADKVEAEKRIAEVKAINERLAARAAAQPAPPMNDPGKPPQAAPFDLFAPFVKTRWDDRWLYVESDGLPHEPWTYPLMVGIKSWQQQVPLPQAYTGNNAWQIPLKPELADRPISGKTQLYRGAIALAANGVPIFNALNNRGDDTFKVGELDEYGGHAGRGDDYHYHIAPLALQKVVGKDKPIAYALDGFPLYGLFDPAAKKGEDKSCPLGGTAKLDELNGHFGVNADGSRGLYHYHASIAYPYINGGVRGKVTVKDDQIDPQPRANPVRQWLQPLRGASITGFKTLAEKSWSLEYTISGKKHLVNFRIEEGGKYVFDFVDPDGTKKTETYTARPQRDRPPPPQGDSPPPDGRRPRGGGRDEPPGDRPPSREDAPAEQPAELKAAASDFKLTSPAVGVKGKLPAEYTCDGASISPPLAWAEPPAGTNSFAVTMHHIPGPPRPGDKSGEDKHVYLVLYNIPATTTSLDKALKKASEGPMSSWGWGVNTVNRRSEYAPPCSKGPGEKKYTLTVYALSKAPSITPADKRGATMDELLAAIKETTLGTATLDVTYARPGK